MHAKRALALWFTLALSGAAQAAPNCLDHAEGVCLEIVRRGSYTSLVASNRTTSPYTFRVVPTQLSNLKPLTSPPFRAVLKPGEEKVVGSLTPIREGRGTSVATRWNAAHGSSLARHDDRWRYRMPFGGTTRHVLSQGVGGRFSHHGPAKYSFDFSMPWGTPVLAARGGRVIRVRDGNIASGTRRAYYDKANSVEVLHPDGTIATYAHLRHGAVVEVGEEVQTGQLIGLSGDTGFSTGPHLHFMVWKRLPDLGWRTVPVRFHDATEKGFLPAPGVAYAPACSTSGMGCAPGEAPPAEDAVPAARAPAGGATSHRREDGACACANGAVLHVDLPCSLVCGG